MLYEDEDEAGQTPAEPVGSRVGKFREASDNFRHKQLHRLRSFTRWLIGASWRTGQSNGASNGAGVPTRWKRVGYPGGMRRPRPSSKSGISFVSQQSGDSELPTRNGRRAELIRISAAARGTGSISASGTRSAGNCAVLSFTSDARA